MSIVRKPGLLAWAKLALLLVATACDTAQADALARLVDRQLTRQHVPGMAVMVLRDGKPVVSRGFGWADLERRVQVTPETEFEIGSVTKQFTAVALMRLVEQGLLALYDPVALHMADLPEAWRGVTLRHLLTHTSGIPDYEEIMGYEGYRQVMTPAKVIALAASKPPDFAPGESWNYSNTGYFLLTLVIEKHSGRSYIDYLRQEVLGPAGMTHTDSSEPTRVLPQRAAGYEYNGDRFENRDAMQPCATGGAGMLVSTLGDLARWDSVLERRALLRLESWQTLWSEARLADGKPSGYGMGWFVGRMRGHLKLEHSGGTPGFTTQVLRLPEDRPTVIVLGNAYNASGVVDLAGQLARRYLPALRYQAGADGEPAKAARVHEYLLHRGDVEPYLVPLTPALAAKVQPYWQPGLARYRERGKLSSVQFLERAEEGAATWFLYRVKYTDSVRIVRVRFDAHDLIDDLSSEEE